MEELIKIKNENGKQLVSARELHEFLEVKSKYADWIKNRIRKYDFEENQDFTTVSKILEIVNAKDSDFPYFRNGKKLIVNRVMLEEWLRNKAIKHETV